MRDAVAQAPCIILNADVVSSPAPLPPCLFNERAVPHSRGEQVASARKIVARVASELPSALLSLGWTTRGEGGYYAEEDVDAMDAVVGAAAAAGLACHARRAGVVAELVFLDVPGAQACPLSALLV